MASRGSRKLHKLFLGMRQSITYTIPALYRWSTSGIHSHAQALVLIFFFFFFWYPTTCCRVVCQGFRQLSLLQEFLAQLQVSSNIHLVTKNCRKGFKFDWLAVLLSLFNIGPFTVQMYMYMLTGNQPSISCDLYHRKEVQWTYRSLQEPELEG